jgi:sugar phosphate permease
MCKAKDEIGKKCCYCKLVAGVCFIISICLLVGGFLMPPQGVIDGSVLAAVGELLICPVIVYGFRAIELGMEVKITKGNTSVEIHKDDD